MFCFEIGVYKLLDMVLRRAPHRKSEKLDMTLALLVARVKHHEVQETSVFFLGACEGPEPFCCGSRVKGCGLWTLLPRATVFSLVK